MSTILWNSVTDIRLCLPSCIKWNKEVTKVHRLAENNIVELVNVEQEKCLDLRVRVKCLLCIYV
jgi:hypothetical protein